MAGFLPTKLLQQLRGQSSICYIVTVSLGYAVLVLAITQLTHFLRQYFAPSTYRIGPIIIPADAPFMLGVLLLFAAYEISSRIPLRSDAWYRLKRVATFLSFATFFKLFFITPLALPRVESLLPFRLDQGRCRLYSQLDQDALADHAVLCAAFMEELSQSYIPLGENERFTVLVFANRGELARVLEQLSLPAGAIGFYLPALDAVLITPDTGYGTLTHELAHAAVHRSGMELAPWAYEGFPIFFEKFIALRTGERIQFEFGFVNAWRLREALPQLAQLRIAALGDPRRAAALAPSIAGLVAFHFWLDGSLRKRITVQDYNLPENGFLRLDDESERRWKEFTTRLVSDKERWLATPESRITSSEQEWRDFIERYQFKR